MSQQRKESSKIDITAINMLCDAFGSEYQYKYDPVGDKLYTWVGTHYERKYEREIDHWVELASGRLATGNNKNEIIRKVKSFNHISPINLKEFFVDSISGKLNLKNGVLDIITKNRTDHSPELGFTSCLPFEHNPWAKAPHFEEFLKAVSCDRQEIINTLKQYIGYCLMPGYENMGHYILWMIGGGRNGKSTYMSIIKALVGRENFSAVTLDQMHDARFLDKMRHKLVNFSSETGDIKISGRTLNVLKELSSGEDLEVDQKYEKASTMTAVAKLIFSANDMPNIPSNQQAMRSRLIPVPFDLELENDERTIIDGDTFKRIRAELPGVLNSVLTAMEDCFRNGRYEINKGKESNAMIHEVLVANDPFEAWVENHLRTVPLEEDKKSEGGLTYEVLMNSFKNYILDGGSSEDQKLRVTAEWMARKLSNKFKSKIHRDRKRLTLPTGQKIRPKVVYGLKFASN